MSKQVNIIIPIAGRAQRFIDCGYNLPKPLISVNGVPMIKLAMDSLIQEHNRENINLIFIVRKDHCVNHHIDNALRNIFEGYNVEIVVIDYITNGTLCTCLCAENLIDNSPTIIYTPDVCFSSTFSLLYDFLNTSLDGLLLTFKANSPDHSYVEIVDDLVVRAVEKQVISNDAIVGVYCFKSGDRFIQYARKLIADDFKINNEFYVAPMFSLMADDGLKIGHHRVDTMHVLGTPDDLRFYESHVIRNSNITKIAVCCDHSGFDLKRQFMSLFNRDGDFFGKCEILDFGAYTDDVSDHYESIRPCVEYVLDHSDTIGVGICCTGQGFNIAANKVTGIRSAIIHDDYTASMCRKHNAVNFICLPSRSIDYHNLSSIVKSILTSKFEGGRHTTRIQKMLRDDLFNG